jgi:hypothetical protein
MGREMGHFLWLAGLLVLFSHSPCFAQLCSLHGRVVDAEGGEAMEFTNVFLANTTSGTSTDARGLFSLSGIPAGDYDIVISRVGYQRTTRKISLVPDSNPDMEFEISRKELRTDEVEVVAPDASEWRRLLEQFTREFLGETSNASHCRILNPYHLNLQFIQESQTLVARCDTVLLVENNALGYRIAIEIEKFEMDTKEGLLRYNLYPRFEELPHTVDDSVRWEKRRRETYRGSMRHFLACVITGVTAEEMFAMYSGSLDELSNGHGALVSPEELQVTPDTAPGIYRLSFGGWIRVEYWGRIPASRSLLTLTAPQVRIDREGIVLTQMATLARGEWSRSRIADLLPLY